MIQPSPDHDMRSMQGISAAAVAPAHLIIGRLPVLLVVHVDVLQGSVKVLLHFDAFLVVFRGGGLLGRRFWLVLLAGAKQLVLVLQV